MFLHPSAELTDGCDLDDRNHPAFRCVNGIIPLRDRAHPFDGEVLQCLKELAEIPAGEYDLVGREAERQRVNAFNVEQRCGDELLVRKEMSFGTRDFDPQTGRRGFTLPARWSSLCRGFVRFEVTFHVQTCALLSGKSPPTCASPCGRVAGPVPVRA